MRYYKVEEELFKCIYNDGYRIRLDVSEIIRDVENAVDKAGEL